MTEVNPLRISRRELEYHKKAFLENSKLTGRVVTITNPTNSISPNASMDDYYDYTGSTQYPQYVHLSQDLPKRVLESYGWLKEDSSAKPLVAYVPMYRYARPDILEEDEGLSKRDKVPFVIRDGAVLRLQSFIEGEPTVSHPSDVELKLPEYTVEAIIYKDDQQFYIVNLAPRRYLTDGIPEESQPESGSQFIQQSDDLDPLY